MPETNDGSLTMYDLRLAGRLFHDITVIFVRILTYHVIHWTPRFPETNDGPLTMYNLRFDKCLAGIACFTT